MTGDSPLKARQFQDLGLVIAVLVALRPELRSLATLRACGIAGRKTLVNIRDLVQLEVLKQ